MFVNLTCCLVPKLINNYFHDTFFNNDTPNNMKHVKVID